MDKDTLHVYVRNLESVLFDGEAEAVSSFNTKGTFDVLPLHSNFISLIEKELQILEKNGQKTTKIPLEKGVMKVKENNVYVYLGVELLQ